MTTILHPEQFLTLGDLPAIRNEVLIRASRNKLLVETVDKLQELVVGKSIFVFDNETRDVMALITPDSKVEIDGYVYNPQAALNLLAWLRGHETVLIDMAAKEQPVKGDEK